LKFENNFVWIIKVIRAQIFARMSKLYTVLSMFYIIILMIQ